MIKLAEKAPTIDNLQRNLATLMAKHNTSEAELSRALNLPYNTVHRLCSGFTSDPRISTLKLIAEYFQVGLDALTGENTLSFNPIEDNAPRAVPILSWSDVSTPDFPNDLNLTHWENWQPVAMAPAEELSKRAYALESKRTMQPCFPMGTVFIIDPDTSAIDGDLVLVKIKETNAVSLRNLLIDPPNWQLIPMVESSPPITYNKEEHTIIGVIVLTVIHTRKD